MNKLIDLFEKETGLLLRKRYGSDGYYEVSGASYSKIQSKIKKFNYKYATNIYCTNNYIKDITTIYF